MKGLFGMNRDLTVGNPRKVLWSFVLPLLISVVFQQMYNIADSVIVGQMSGSGEAGEAGVAAIGASYPVTMIFMAIALGANSGCSVIISQLFGSKKFGDMKTAIYTSFISVLVLSAIFLAAGLPLAKPILKLLETPSDIFSDSISYLNVFILAFPFLFVYNVATGIFTSIGDSRTPLYFLIGSSVGNIALDLLFVGVFRWGVRGAAWATFAAQGIAMAGTLVVLLFRFRLWRDYKCKKFSVAMLKKISLIAIPSILQQSFVSVGNLFIQALVNKYGTAVVAGYTAASKLNIFAVNCFVTMSNGVSNFTAQNYGIEDKARIKQGFKWGCVLSLIISLPFFLMFFIFPNFAVRLFMSEVSEEALTAGSHFLMFVSPFYFIICLKLISDGVLRGTVKVWCFLISTFSDLLLRVGFAYILAGPLGLQSDGIWLSWPVGWTLSTEISLIFYFSDIWSRKLNKTD